MMLRPVLLLAQGPFWSSPEFVQDVLLVLTVLRSSLSAIYLRSLIGLLDHVICLFPRRVLVLVDAVLTKPRDGSLDECHTVRHRFLTKCLRSEVFFARKYFVPIQGVLQNDGFQPEQDDFFTLLGKGWRVVHSLRHCVFLEVLL